MQSTMTENKTPSSKSHGNLLKNLDFLKQRSFDVKFDLDGTGYTAVEKIGIGAFGVVCSAIHSRTGDKVAIKKIAGVFDAETVTKRTFREIKILKHFKHDNIISIREILKPREGPTDFQDIYVVLDLMESDLHQIIYSRQPLTEEHIRYFLYQILRGLKYIHSANVIHRDLKPKNLLVRENCHLRIGDFGMARGISSSHSENEDCFLTLYVATRWYRAPEIMFSLLDYCSAIDIWSVGCIFAEMLGRKHLFPGKYYIEQAQLIINVLGSPSEKFLSACKSDIIKTFIKQMGKKNPIPLSRLYPKASRRALDLLGQMLVLNPSDRVTVEQALRHPYFTGYHDPDDEPICVPAFNFDFEKQYMTKVQFRDAICNEINEFHENRHPTLNFSPVLRPAPKTNENLRTSIGDVSARSPSLDGSLEITEQGAALQAFVKQLRERLNASTSAKHAPGGKENQESSQRCHFLSEDVDPNSSADSATSTKTSLLCDENLSALPHDVEMLSAKSTESKMDASSSSSSSLLSKSAPMTLQSQPQDLQGSSGSDHQTISADTKELIKAALRNATLKKRGGETEAKDDGRPRPVTAAQRQREREDKRRKRRERSMKRMKVKKDPDSEEKLSEADRELLERWQKMQTQKATSQLSESTPSLESACPRSTFSVHPEREPVSVLLGDSSQQQASCNGNVGQSLMLCNSAANCVVPLPHHVTGGTPESGTTNHSLQVENNNAGGSRSECNLKPNNDGHFVDLQAPALFELLNQRNDADSLTTNARQGFNTLDVGSLHLLGLLNMQQSGQLGPNYLPLQKPHNLARPNESSSSSHVSLTAAMCLTERSLTPASSSANHIPNSINCNTSSEANSLRNSLSTSPLAPNLLTSTFNDDNNNNNNNGNNNNNINNNHPPGTIKITAAAASSPTPISSPSLFVRTDISPSTISGDDGFPWKDVPFEHPSADMTLPSSGNVVFGMMDKNDPKADYIMSPVSSSTLSPSSRSLMVNSNETNFPGGSFEDQYPTLPAIQVSNIEEGNGNELAEKSLGTLHEEGSSDLISALSKQLSKYQVEDAVPPALTLTPKGTGDGYGVGLDLDTFMAENLADKNESSKFISPLSSSLLANWMDVTANLDIQGLEKELELSMHSPMALSYSDLRLCSS